MLRTLDIGYLDDEWVITDKVGDRYINTRSTTNWAAVLREHDKFTVRRVVCDRITAQRLRRDRPQSRKIVG